ncbi:MAG: bifunctional tetrahydrofolate synthase/dihydrofolate synthase [Betaproteobacteria bacterium]|nr:bifunctional tetrahydrofolate synthase/dihydrofolate synthase [Betaproteobacteria bacterium]
MNLEPETLAEWLAYIERLHPKTIALGLERVGHVKERLALEPCFPLVVVGGTNGKGSTCAILESILHLAGYRVGCYTSPHFLRYNERVRVGRIELPDAALVRAFGEVERMRDDVELTYFEYGTLAALWLFVEQRVDVAVLEVGLGGRLDAVNAFDADCAVVTAVDIDHVDYLGVDREAIGAEKAGIFRAGRPAVCSDPSPPERLVRHAAEIGAGLLRIEQDFGAKVQGKHWQYWGPRGPRSALPHPVLRGAYQLDNAAAAITALECLRERLPVAMNDIRQGLLQVELPGRFQVMPGRPPVILDVAHNPHAARALAANLAAMGCTGRTYSVFAMFGDKDVAGVVAALAPQISHWVIAGMAGPRGADAGDLERALGAAGIGASTRCASVADAYAQACDMATENDRIVVFGSFYTVASVMALLERRRRARASG